MDQTVRRCAVLGDPIDHSLSPVLHRAAYRALGLEGWRYDRIRVGHGSLPTFWESLDPTWAGLSLTMPLKKAINQMGTAADHWSGVLGVSNTAVLSWSQANRKGGGPAVSLTNTDVEGIVCAFKEAEGSLKDPDQSIGIIKSVSTGTMTPQPGKQLRALILGNGNTAESALCALGFLGVVHIDLVARRPDATGRLIDLAKELNILVGAPHGMDDSDCVSDLLCQADLVVSALPAHAADPLADLLDSRSNRHSPQSAGLSKAPHLLLDVAYEPRPSRLTQAWQNRTGGRAISGDRMLLYQAVRQVAQMTGQPLESIPVKAMDRALKEEMQ